MVDAIKPPIRSDPVASDQQSVLFGVVLVEHYNLPSKSGRLLQAVQLFLVDGTIKRPPTWE